MSVLRKVTEADFKGIVLDNPDPTVVLFKSEWCPGCKQVLPVLEELAGEGVSAVYVDVTESPALAAEYGVMSIPATLIVAGGEVKEKLVGQVGKEAIKKALA